MAALASIASGVLNERLGALCDVSVAQRGLEVAIQVFGGIQAGLVGGWVEDLDAIGPLGKPGLGRLGVLDLDFIDNLEDLALRVVEPDEALEGVDGALGVKRTVDEAEAYEALSGSGRDHLSRCVPARRHAKLGRHPRRCVASDPMPFLANFVLVALVDFGVLDFGARLDRRVLGLQPLPDLGRALLQRPLHRTLRREAPALQVKANRADLQQGVGRKRAGVCIRHKQIKLKLFECWGYNWRARFISCTGRF
jgi:hypothetical protein